MAKGFWKKAFSIIGIEPTDVDEEEYYEDEMDEAEEQSYSAEPEESYYDFEEPKFSRRRSKVIEMPQPGSTVSGSRMKVIIFRPSSYEETQEIIDNLKSKKPIIVNLDDLDVQIAQRILDFISGAVYALGGDIRKAARNIFVVVPSNVDIATNLAGEDDGIERNII